MRRRVAVDEFIRASITTYVATCLYVHESSGRRDSAASVDEAVLKKHRLDSINTKGVIYTDEERLRRGACSFRSKGETRGAS
jgi:hypothetical protein